MLEPLLARRVQLLAMAVDGVLTGWPVFAGGLGGHLGELRPMDARDGLGVQLLRAAGVRVVAVTGRAGEGAHLDAAGVFPDDLIEEPQGRKLVALEAALHQLSIRFDDMAYVGAELADLPILRRAGFPIAVAGAPPEVTAAARLVTTTSGGQGVLRELAEVLLRARGQWDTALQAFLSDHGDRAARVSRAR